MAAPGEDVFRPSQWIANAASLEERHAHFHEADASAAHARILQVSDGRCRFTVQDTRDFVQFRGAHARAGRIAIKFLSWNCQAKCETSVVRTSDHHLALHIPLAGSFSAVQDGQMLDVHPGQMLVVSAPGRVRRSWEGPCDLLNVMIARPPAQSCSAEPMPVIANLPMTLLNLRRERTLALFIENLVQDLGEKDPAFCESSTALQAEKLLLTLLARSMGERLQLAPLRNSAVAPYYVRRAEEHIARHFAEAINMRDLAGACGVSVRTLHYGFATYRDYTALEHLRLVRLTAAREALAKEDGNVATIARAVGYRNGSQFSRDYKAQFGETPSRTRRYAAG